MDITDHNVYLLGQNKYLQVVNGVDGWSVFKCADLGFAGSDKKQLHSGINAQKAHRFAHKHQMEQQ